MQRLLGFFQTTDIPPLSRRNYLPELQHMALWGTVVGAVEGNLAGIVASKTFGASAFLTTVVCTLPIVMNAINFLWAGLIRGRSKMPLLFLISGGVCLSLLSVFWTPRNAEWAAPLFAAQMAAAHFFLSGLLLVRTAIWQANYPEAHRGQVAARLQALRLFTTMIASTVFSGLFDRHPEAYFLVYPLVGFAGLAALIPLRTLRIRRERPTLVRYASQNHSRTASFGTALVAIVAILRQDRVFARYMAGQFLLGSANFFTEPVLLILLTQRLGYGYLISTFLMTILPLLLQIAFMRVWAPFYDRVGVVRFRVFQSALWFFAYTLVAAGVSCVLTGSTALTAVGVSLIVGYRILFGVSRAGGQIAWTLGHLHFARPDQSELYQTVHIVLTGIRGLIMPLLGLFMFQVLGGASFVVVLSFVALAYGIFLRLAQDDRGVISREEACADELTPTGTPSNVS